MLYGLFGNKSIEKILFFLLVNEKTYATQLHRLLHTPLTPLQKALERLEREGILKSFYEGKTRFYMFNPHYPLLAELEMLLKKAYTLLVPSEKKHYYVVHPISSQRKITHAALHVLWERLKNVSQMTFQFRAKGGGRGFGTGEVKLAGVESELIFRERGSWRGENGEEFLFRNIFRWTWNRFEGMLTLEHLRFGIDNPVFLFHLRPSSNNALESVHTHLCGQDTYFGHLIYPKEYIELTWRILGPKKNDEVKYTYR